MRTIIAKRIGTLAATLLIASCATTSLVDSWHNPGLASGTKYHKLLVTSISRNVNERRVYEDVIAAELRQRGIEATTSYGLIAADERDNRVALAKAVKESASEALLSVQTTLIEQKMSVDPGYINGYADFWYPSDFQRWNMSGYLGSRAFYEPPTIYTYNVATIQAYLFDTASGKLTWAASLETYEPAKILKVSRDVARIVVMALMKEGLI